MRKVCQRCQTAPRRKGEKYCKECRKAVLDEMKESGYLQRNPFTPHRSVDQREDVRETKYGADR